MEQPMTFMLTTQLCYRSPITTIPALLNRLGLITLLLLGMLNSINSVYAESQTHNPATEADSATTPEATTNTTDTLKAISQLLASNAEQVANNPELAEINVQLEKLKLENARLSLENALQSEKHKNALHQLQQEKERLALENELQDERNRAALTELIAHKDKLLLENEIQEALQQQMLRELEAQKQRLELENTIQTQREQQIAGQFSDEYAAIVAKNRLQEERNREFDLHIQKEISQINYALVQLEYEKAQRSSDLELLSEQIAERERREEWESQANQPIEYLTDPYVNGTLVISDRRIGLDGPIIRGTADYIIKRLNYFNNKSTEYPIFIVIDNCAGGSVMEGSKIVKAMQASRAPVYVVVTSLAASMAAVITAMAERSFAYPDAIIVHHQVWSAFFGNKTQQEEHLDVTKEWSSRIISPVAEKMGLTMDEFVKQMYQNNSDGNWREFADSAVALKWVDHVVTDVQETSFIKKPEENDVLLGSLFFLELEEEQYDASGNPYLQLPRLNPNDVYHLYNPDNYYRY